MTTRYNTIGAYKECKDCGSVVSNTVSHNQWHKTQELINKKLLELESPRKDIGI